MSKRFLITTMLLSSILPSNVFAQDSAAPADPRGQPIMAADGGPGTTATADQLMYAAVAQNQRLQQIWDVSAAAEPALVFRYRFWPQESSLRAGSAQLHFFRALTAMHSTADARTEIRRLSGVDDWVNTAELPKARALLESMQPVMQALTDMAFSEDLSWDNRIRDIQGPSLYYVHLEDVQQARVLGRLLQIKTRIHVRDGDFDSATQTVLIGNRLAALIGNGESVIQHLVGGAIAAMMRTLVEEMIQAPNSPNLYWAIATIPLPLVTMRRAIELELESVHRAFPALRDARTENWSEPEAKRRWVDAIMELKKLDGTSHDLSNLQILQALDSSAYLEPAKSRLKATGLTDAQLDLMAPTAIVMADAAAELERIRDESMKGILLPRLQRQELRAIQAKTNVNPRWTSSYLQSEWMGDQRTTNGGALFASVLFPGILQLETAEIRTPVIYLRLMTLEAIRMHVATHDGEIPATLDKLSPVPALTSQETEKSFDYQIETTGGDRVLVLSGDIAGFEAARHLRFRFRQSASDQ